MTTMDFTKISARYEQDSLVQRSASEKLISMLGIHGQDDILDLGCGTGHITRQLRSLTAGAVVGVDPSDGMIAEAEAKRNGLDIRFAVQGVEDLQYVDAFSVIFCNSAFQWFRDPVMALANSRRALRNGGRIGIQAPAKKAYCPVFLKAIDAVAKDPRTGGVFASFRSPWLFFDAAYEYATLFSDAGFRVLFAEIREQTEKRSPAEVTAIFESGAAAGYLNRDYYAASINDAYAADFREIVRNSFQEQAGQDGKVDLTFNRIYLAAKKVDHDGE